MTRSSSGAAGRLSRRNWVLVAASSAVALACGGGTGDDDGSGRGGGTGGGGGMGGGGASGGEGGSAPDAGHAVECSDAAGTITIVRNHGHHLLVPRQDIEAGVETSYDIMGASAHPHTVVLGAADFEALARGETLTLTSSFDEGHEHEVVIACG